MDKDSTVDLSRSKRDTGIQYRRQQKDEVKGLIPKLVVQPEYGTGYQHQGMLLQNLHRCYLNIVIRLPKLKDLEQKILTFPNCDNHGVSRSSNPNPTSDEIKHNDNALYWQICTHFKVDYLEEMDIIKQTKRQIEQKVNETLPALLLNKIIQTSKGLEAATGMKGQLHFGSREKRAVPVMAILQAGEAIGGTLIKGIKALVDAKRAKSFNNALKMVTANVELTHQRLRTLENRTSMMVKAIMPVLDVLKGRIADRNQKLTSQYRMMQMAHHRYNLLFRWMLKLMIHHFALLLFKNYLTIQVGALQRIHHQYNRYESSLDDTLIGIESLSSGYLTHHILDPKILARYLEAIADDMEDMALDYKTVFTDIYQYYGNSLASFTHTKDDLILQLPIIFKLKFRYPCHFIVWRHYQYHWMQKHTQVQNESTLKYCPKLNTLH